MQLSLIVQLSIAMLASELAGTLPIAGWVCALIALAGPLLVLAFGSLLARRAVRGMDRGEERSVEQFFALSARAHWLATLCIAVAACGDLAPAWSPHIGNTGIAVFLVSCGVAASLALSLCAWTIERRIRESSLMRSLDSGRAAHAMPSRGAYVLAQARAGLAPILAPLVVPLVCSEVVYMLALRHAPEYAEHAQLAGGIAGTLLLFLLVPVLVPFLLGLKRLESGEMRNDLEELAASARVRVTEIWVWPTDGLIANAAVMGIFPGLRCVMLSDALLECMPRTQVRAVMAHELGHVVHRHLPWLIAVILACWALAGVAAQAIAEAVFAEYATGLHAASAMNAAHSFSLARDAGVLIAGLYAFGFVSRRFERQADTFAVQLLSTRAGSEVATQESVSAMVDALGSVAFLNHVPKRRPSWRHGSIAWRQTYLRALVGAVHQSLAIDWIVAAMRWTSLLVVLGLLVLSLIEPS